MDILNHAKNVMTIDNVNDILFEYIIPEFFDNNNDALLDAIDITPDLYDHFDFYVLVNNDLYELSTNVRYYEYTKIDDNDFYDYRIDTLCSKLTKIDDEDIINNIMKYDFIVNTDEDVLQEIYKLFVDNRIYLDYLF